MKRPAGLIRSIVLCLFALAARDGAAPQSTKPAPPAKKASAYPFVVSVDPNAVFQKTAGGYTCPPVHYQKVGSTAVKAMVVLIRVPFEKRELVLHASDQFPVTPAGTVKPQTCSERLNGVFSIMQFGEGGKISGTADLQVALFDHEALGKDDKDKYPESARLSPWVKVPGRFGK